MKTHLFCTLAALCALGSAKEPIDYIDPLIGTEGKGSQYGGMMPMTGVPFGSIQWVPMTRLTEVGALSYNEIDAQLLGFIGTRQPAIWMGDWGQVSFMPRTCAVDCDFSTRGTPFDHAREQVSPWRSRIESGGIVTDYAGTSRAAVYTIRFPKGAANPHVVVDASRDYIGRPTDKTPADGFISIGADDCTITGWNADRLDAHHAYPLPNFRGWFVMEFSRPFTSWGCYTGVPRAKGYQGVKQIPNQRTAQANRVGGWVVFAPDCEELVVKVGVSLISLEQARANLRAEIPENGAAAVDAVAARSRAAWSAQFARLVIETPREDVKTIFYTGLYHALLYPREIDEGGRYYSAFDDRVHEGRMYNCYSLWDTYRAEHPLLTFVAPERVDGMMQALVEMYREGGWLPKWPNPSYTGIMIGAPAEVVLAEAWTKGFRGFDVKTAYAAVKKNATVPQPTDDQFRWEDRGLFGRTPETRGGLASYMKRGWVACDRTTESVSRTQDFSLDDTAAAILAEAAGDADGAALFRTRSHSWTNVWNAERGYFLPRKADGSWADPRSGHHYCECSPETALWCVPHDVEKLVQLMGGAKEFERRLDGFFDTVFWKPERGNKSIHGNEPSHHVAYLYNRIGAYDKTARRVRDILTRSYSTDRKGFDGNEDCGQMSAWYILSALGIYPLNPADGWYEIGSPLIDRAMIRLDAPYKPATLSIVVRNQSPENGRVKSVTFNGKPLDERRIHHNDLVRGGTLEFEMAADARPYEIVWANRTHDDHEPILPMTDAAGWRVEAANAVARLESATDRRMFGPGVVRLIYRGTDKNPRVRILPPKPVRVEGAFDTVSLWIYGNNVYYSAKAKGTPSTTLTAEFVDADGKPFSVKVAYINHLEWWLAQKRLAEDIIPRATRGATFTGFTLTGGTNTEDRSLDFTSFCVFKEEFAPVSFKARAKRANRVFPDAPAGINTGDGTLPFPNRALTVVPPASGETFLFRLPSDLAIWDDLAFSRNGGKTWQLFAKGGGLWFAPDDPKGKVFRAACPYTAVTNRAAPLDVTCRGTCAATGCRVEVRFHVEGQSLVADVRADGGRVAEVRFGSWPDPLRPRLVRVPYYTYNGYGAARPFVLVTDTASGPIFHAATMDWTQSNASTPFSDPDLVEDALGANGGTRYIPRTDGVRNPCFERFVYSFGSRFADVLPMVPNDVSPWKHVTGSVVWRAHGAGNRENDTAYWRKVRNRGMKHVLVTDHETGWRDGNESFTFRTNPAPKKGGDKGQYDYARTMIDKFGFWYGPYNNFTDFAPINGNWSADRVSRTADNQLQTAWNRCYAPKPAYAVNACEELTPIIQGKFHFNTAYCDVHTAVSPWGRCDYDARIPGGGTFANTFYAFGEIMLIQKKNWNGPVYSEGNTHFMYCGLTDGNYAQDQNYRISDNPWLVDFDLLRLHPLCCNFGMGNPGMFYPGKSAPTNNVVATDRFLAATVAFGHPGFLLHDPHMERSYFMVQQLAARYTMADAVEIRYVDAEGRAHETSDAVASGVFARSQVTVRYSDGTFVAANGSMDEAMRVALGGDTLWLPPNGYFGFTRDGKVLTYSGLIDGHRVDYAYSPEYVYLDARGTATTLGGVSTNKVCVRLAEREDISHIALASSSDIAKRSAPPAGMFKPKTTVPDVPLPFIRHAGICIRGQKEGPATPESKGHTLFGSQQTCGGVSKRGIVMHPPYGKGTGYAFASFRLDAGGPHVFHAFVGKGDGSDLGDGIYYKVCVQTPDGKRTVLAEETVRTHEWRPIRADLRPWAGTNVRLVLIADCGPKNNTCGDWAAWGDCSLSAE